MKEYLHDFAWGDTRGIREIMSKMMYAEGITNSVPWHAFGYPPHEGESKLIQYTRSLIENLTGHRYKHILITNGATHALNAYIGAIKDNFVTTLNTHKLYFIFYPGIAKNHILNHDTTDHLYSREDTVTIVDSPSNPEGKLYINGPKENVIWDAAYYTPAYCGQGKKDSLECIQMIPNHMAMAGSFNKLTGINGLRVGWLATDDDYTYHAALQYIEHDICGVSYPSQYMALQIIKYVDLNRFYSDSKDLIDNNKTEMTKLGYLFGNQDIPNVGMFALLEADKKLKKLLEKASVNVMDGALCGDERQSVRFNLANGNQATSDMVKAILKADGNSWGPKKS